MDNLSAWKRSQILQMLCEGSSMRSISRIAGVSTNTVTKLLVDAGTACTAYHEANVKGAKAKHVQCDEIWAFCGSEEKIRPKKRNFEALGTFGLGQRLMPIAS